MLTLYREIRTVFSDCVFWLSRTTRPRRRFYCLWMSAVRRPSASDVPVRIQTLRVPAEDTRRTRAVTRVRSVRVHGSSNRTRVVHAARRVSRAKRKNKNTETREPKSDDTAVGEERLGVSSTRSSRRCGMRAGLRSKTTRRKTTSVRCDLKVMTTRGRERTGWDGLPGRNARYDGENSGSTGRQCPHKEGDQWVLVVSGLGYK